MVFAWTDNNLETQPEISQSLQALEALLLSARYAGLDLVGLRVVYADTAISDLVRGQFRSNVIELARIRRFYSSMCVTPADSGCSTSIASQ